MSAQAIIPIGIPPGTKILRIERCEAKDSYYQGTRLVMNEGYWMLWINADQRYEYGTYIKLFDNGKIDRVTQRPDGSEDIMSIKHGVG